MNQNQTAVVETADTALNLHGLPTYSELLALLRRADKHTTQTYRVMLNQAATYGEQTLNAVMREPTWLGVEADYKDIRFALERVA